MPSLERPETGHNEPDRPIGTVRKNAREDIAVKMRSYKGYRFVDLRVMARRPDGGALPTGKGVAMKAEAIPKIIELLQQAHAEAVEAGWCDGDGR